MSRLTTVLVLGIAPLTLAVAAGVFALLLGCSFASAGMQTCLLFAALSVAGWVDLLREQSAHDLSDEHYFRIRQCCALALPFVAMGAWGAVHVGFEAALSLKELVYPFAVGSFLGRAAIEFHYFQRPTQVDPFGPESISYHDDRP